MKKLQASESYRLNQIQKDLTTQFHKNNQYLRHNEIRKAVPRKVWKSKKKNVMIETHNGQDTFLLQIPLSELLFQCYTGILIEIGDDDKSP